MDGDCGGGSNVMVDEPEMHKVDEAGNVEEDDCDDADSGLGSDDYDLLELGEIGAEFCMVEDQTCSIPLQLYDLPDFSGVLSLEVWNECLSDEDRFDLAKYLPDLDEVTFMKTLNELLSGGDFYFGSPVTRLFEMLKGGLCEPRVAMYRQGMMLFQKYKHYHQLRKRHNDMVSSLFQIRDVWMKCRGYSVEEKICELDIMKSQKNLMYEKVEDIALGRVSSGRDEPEEDIRSQTLTQTKARQKMVSHVSYQATPSRSSGKRNQKGMVKLADMKSPATDLTGCLPFDPYDSSLALPKHGKKALCDPKVDLVMGDRFGVEEAVHNAVVQRGCNVSSSNFSRVQKSGKRHGRLRDDFSSPTFKGIPLLFKDDEFINHDSHQVNQLSDIKVLTSKPSVAGLSYDYGKKMKYFGDVLTGEYTTNYGKGVIPFPLSAPGNSHVGISHPSELFWHKKYPPEAFNGDQTAQDGWESRNRKQKMKRGDLDLNVNSYLNSLSQINDGASLSNYLADAPAERMGGSCVQNGAPDMIALRGVRNTSQNDETESDSSQHFDEESNPFLNRKSSVSSGGGPNVDGLDLKRANYAKKRKKANNMQNDSLRAVDRSDKAQIDTLEEESCFLTRKHNKEFEISHAYNTASMPMENEIVSKKGALNSVSSTRNKKKLGKNRNLLEEPEARSNGSLKLSLFEEQSSVPQPESSRAAKKRKRKETAICMKPQDDFDLFPSNRSQQFDSLPSGLDNVEGAEVKSPVLDMADPQCTEMELIDVELEAKTSKRVFTPVTPTVHTSFTFSVIHLLSAVRIMLITPELDDDVEVSRPLEKDNQLGVLTESNEEAANGVGRHGNVESNSAPQVQANVPNLTFEDIVNRVRSNPGDPCILETKEPLEELVRGTLKTFSSKKAPLGAKNWKPLAAYKRSTKSWSWIGPIPQSSSSDQEAFEEVTSPEAWGLPRNMLVKLVDFFANWLKSSHEILQQLGSLPAPPESLSQYNLEEKDRFNDQRAPKSFSTIEPHSAEVREYFHREEALRYSVPDRVFAYTAADGRKSVVAPLRRSSSKPTSKARDHFMLKPDRPAHVTILCLVRDASARLPGCIGTRADICTLMRDSQYIMEDVSDAQLNQVVSGALDRLHYEHDPCVHFDGDRKLWVYLHRERAEEDFEDDGTSTTKRWKRQKKDPGNTPDEVMVIAPDQDNNEQIGLQKPDINDEAVQGTVGAPDQYTDEQIGFKSPDNNDEAVQGTVGAPDQDTE